MSDIPKIGIASLQEMRERMLAVAAGKRAIGPDEPKIWFPTEEAMKKALADKNSPIFKQYRDIQD